MMDGSDGVEARVGNFGWMPCTFALIWLFVHPCVAACWSLLGSATFTLTDDQSRFPLGAGRLAILGILRGWITRLMAEIPFQVVVRARCLDRDYPGTA